MKRSEAALEDLKEHSDRVAWGAGRVAFRANLPTIQDELNAGWPMSTVYRRIQSSLAGLSYRAFTKLASKHCRPATKLATKQYHVATAPVVEKPKPFGEPQKFRPGPRIPDPKDLY
jgi:hypothetical protein